MGLWRVSLKIAVSAEPIVIPVERGPFQEPAAWLAENFRDVFPILVIVAALAKGVLSYFFNVLRCRLGHGVSRMLRGELFATAEVSASDELEGVGKAALVSRFVHDIDAIERMISDGLVRASQCLVEVCVLFALCLVLDWQLSVLFFVVYPLVILPLLGLTRRLKAQARRTQVAIADSATVFQDQMHTTKMIQSLGYPDVLRARLSKAMDEFYEASLSVVRLKSASSPLAEILGAVALCTTIAVCAWRMSGGETGGTSSISFIACLLLMYKPVKGLGELPQLIGPGGAALQRLDELSTAKVEHEGHIEPWDDETPIRLEGVRLERGGVCYSMTCP